jgi:post-segregation antitoxin (ccd killing protein)
VRCAHHTRCANRRSAEIADGGAADSWGVLVVPDYLSARAKAKGVNVGTLVNDLLKRDIELIEVAK